MTVETRPSALVQLRSASLVQWGLFIVCALHMPVIIAGWIAEPSFAIGTDAPTADILGMDYNGWHAAAGALLFAPGLVLALRKSWAVLGALAIAMGGILPGIWALFSPQVMYVMHMPNNTRDAIVHFVTAGVLLVLVGVQAARDGGVRALVDEVRADLRRR